MTDAMKREIDDHWKVGNVKIIRVIESEHGGFPPILVRRIDRGSDQVD
jgi:hypothetical protein